MSEISRSKRSTRRTTLIGVFTLFLLFYAFEEVPSWVKFTTTTGVAVSWNNDQAIMNPRLGCASNGPLTAFNCWDDALIAAGQAWNSAGSSFTFHRWTTPKIASSCSNDGINNVTWSYTKCGLGWGTSIGATRTVRDVSGNILDADVMLNKNLAWNAYHGYLGGAVGGGVLNDAHRVLLHELGHVLGLGHPDANGQYQNSIMNTEISNTYTLQADDIAGVKALYPAAAPSPSGGTLGSNDYCVGKQCAAGQGDCDGNSQCASGLVCSNDVGAKYGFRSYVDVCESPSSGGGTLGSNDYCVGKQCTAGQGDCDSNSECASGLYCSQNTGAQYGFRSYVDVCATGA